MFNVEDHKIKSYHMQPTEEDYHPLILVGQSQSFPKAILELPQRLPQFWRYLPNLGPKCLMNLTKEKMRISVEI